MYDDYDEQDWIEDEAEDGDDLLVCPSCLASVHEETQQCPHCGDWIIPVYPGSSSRRIAALVVVALLLASIVLVYVL